MKDYAKIYHVENSVYSISVANNKNSVKAKPNGSEEHGTVFSPFSLMAITRM